MSGGDTCSNRGRYFSSHQQLQLRMASGFPGAGQNMVGGDLPFDFFWDLLIGDTDAHEREGKWPPGLPFA